MDAGREKERERERERGASKQQVMEIEKHSGQVNGHGTL